jgi:predicted ATPase
VTDPDSLQLVRANPAAALFIDRARAIRPDFRLTEDNADAVARIAVGLEGLPLSLELAAQGVRSLGVEEVLSRIRIRMSLSAEIRDVPERQRSVSNTLMWSYVLLNDSEQRLFRRMAVFARGGTAESMEAVYNARRDLDAPVSTILEGLVDASLVEEADDDARNPTYALLETVREFALELLVASGEEEEIAKAVSTRNPLFFS